MNMQKLLVASLLSLALATPSLAQDKPFKVSGCAFKGIEFGCIVLHTVTGKAYNISTAQPMPTPDSYGTVVGTLRNGETFCLQGPVIEPATWTEKGRHCPFRKAKK
jgi:hypothetical protein